MPGNEIYVMNSTKWYSTPHELGIHMLLFRVSDTGVVVGCGWKEWLALGWPKLYCCICDELWGKLGCKPLQKVGSLLSMLGADFKQRRGGIPIPRCPPQSRRQGGMWSALEPNKVRVHGLELKLDDLQTSWNLWRGLDLFVNVKSMAAWKLSNAVWVWVSGY
jgi:hypothetical protein